MKSILKKNRILAVIALIAFISCEKKGSNPLMPFHLFKYRGFTLGLIAMVAYGPACYSFSTYTAQIGVGVLGLSSTHTGTFLAVHAIGYLIFNFVWGKLISAKGPRALKPVQLICLLGLAISMIILTFARPGSSAVILYAAEFLGGAFNSALIVGFTQILQKEIPREYIGTGTSLLQFMMKLGGTLGITIGGMMFELGELDTLPVVFDEKLRHGTIDHVTVHADVAPMVFHRSGFRRLG